VPKLSSLASSWWQAKQLPPLSARDQARLLERLRTICLALPDVTEKLSHGEATFFHKKRSFLNMDTYHHGEDRFAAGRVVVQTRGAAASPQSAGALAQHATMQHDRVKAFQFAIVKRTHGRGHMRCAAPGLCFFAADFSSGRGGLLFRTFVWHGIEFGELLL